MRLDNGLTGIFAGLEQMRTWEQASALNCTGTGGMLMLVKPDGALRPTLTGARVDVAEIVRNRAHS